MLSRPITPEFLEAISRRRPEVLYLLRRVKDEQLAKHDFPELRRISPHRVAREQALGVRIAEALDHQ